MSSQMNDEIVLFSFAIKGLVPHVEKQLRTLHEIVTNRKGRSLFNVGVKRWFGQSKPGTASGTSVVYGRDATELQMRKLGDLYFMFKLYKQAYNCYHTAKKDFQVPTATFKTHILVTLKTLYGLQIRCLRLRYLY